MDWETEGGAMRRDMDLIRDILIAAADAEGDLDCRCLVSPERGAAAIAYNVSLMQGAGLVDASVSYAAGAHGRQPVSIVVRGLTWEGCDYLDSISSDFIWERVKRAVGETVGDTALSVVKQSCQALALSLVKGQLGV